MKETPGLLYRDELKLGIDELQWLQAENDQQSRRQRMAMMRTPGLVVPRVSSGDLGQQWRVFGGNGVTAVTIRAVSAAPFYDLWPDIALAIDNEGYFIALMSNGSVDVPNDDTWYTITMTRADQQEEEGTLSCTAGSANVAGVGTQFTRFSGKTTDAYGRGTLIRIAAGANAGTYEVDTVTSDTAMTLTSTTPALEAGRQFYVAGDYAISTPADPDIHLFARPVFTRSALTREVAEGTYVLADVKRNDAGAPDIKVIDRRKENLWRSYMAQASAFHAARFIPSVAINVEAATVVSALTHNIRTSTTAIDGSIAPYYDSSAVTANNFIAAVEDSGTGNIYSVTFAGPTAWNTPVNVTAGTDPSIVSFPEGSDVTHALYYIDANVLYVRRSADNGVTWSGATTALDPTLVDAADTCASPCAILSSTRRVLIAVSYFDNSAGRTEIRYVFSDDYGATHDIDAGSGYETQFQTAATTYTRPCIAQDELGRIWIAAERSATIYMGTINDKNMVYDNSGPDPTPTQVVGLVAFYESVRDPALWISPDGQVVCAYAAYDLGTTTSQLRAAVIGYGYGRASAVGFECIADHLLATLDTGLGADQEMGVALAQGRSGHVLVGFVNTNNNDYYALEFSPAMLPLMNSGPLHD